MDRLRQGTRVLHADGTQYDVEFNEPVTVVTAGRAQVLDGVRLIVLKDDSGQRIAARVEDFEDAEDGQPPLFTPI